MTDQIVRTVVRNWRAPASVVRLGASLQRVYWLPLLLLPMACGQTETGETDATSSDATSSGTGSSTGAGTGSGSATTTGSSSVGTGASSSVTSAQASTESSSNGSETSSTDDDSSASGEPSTLDSQSDIVTTDEGTTSARSSEEAGPDAGGGSSDDGSSDDSTNDDGSMSFFVSSTGVDEGGNLGGLEGADAFCTQLAAAVSESLGNKTWRAYLSTSTVNAKDRIGTGPWRNADGVVVANDLDELHAQEPGEALDETWPPADLGIALTETGEQVPNNIHDILTGSLPDGTVDADRHCNDWTSSETTDEASVGHSNRDGGGRPPYFNATHQVGCAPSATNYDDGTVTAGGGQGAVYCFALTD